MFTGWHCSHEKVLEARRMKPWEEPVPAIPWPSRFLRTLILGKPSPSPTPLPRAGVRIMANILLTADSFYTVCVSGMILSLSFILHVCGTLMVPGHQQSLRVILRVGKPYSHAAPVTSLMSLPLLPLLVPLRYNTCLIFVKRSPISW